MTPGPGAYLFKK